MKNRFKVLALVLMTALTIPALANEKQKAAKSSTLKTGMYFSKDGKLNINFENHSDATAKILITDANQNVVFRKKAKPCSDISALKLDFDQLPDGRYNVEISNDKDKVTQNVQLETPKRERVGTFLN